MAWERSLEAFAFRQGSNHAIIFLPIGSSVTMALLLAAFGASVWLINPLIVTWGNRLVPESPSFISALMMGMAWCFAHLVTIASGVFVQRFSQTPCQLSLAVLGVLLVLTCVFAISMPREASPVLERSAQ
ncbi:MAG: hypothetical protein KGZ30_00530 [Anaplasmataceae bacterium]|nr:hypothetical protein [Anaplasmataceae bacterium]